MKFKPVYSCIVVFLISAAVLFAGDISGKWYVPMDGVDVEMVFKVAGSTVTGTVNNPLSGETNIKDGRIENDTLTFYVVRKLGNRDARIAWTGLVTGEEIAFTRAMGGARPLKVIARRERTIPGPSKKGNPSITL
jgi:hypothetical protein